MSCGVGGAGRVARGDTPRSAVVVSGTVCCAAFIAGEAWWVCQGHRRARRCRPTRIVVTSMAVEDTGGS
jgi:hypothetical protein